MKRIKYFDCVVKLLNYLRNVNYWGESTIKSLLLLFVESKETNVNWIGNINAGKYVVVNVLKTFENKL